MFPFDSKVFAALTPLTPDFMDQLEYSDHIHLQASLAWELERIGPIDNRPSTD